MGFFFGLGAGRVSKDGKQTAPWVPLPAGDVDLNACRNPSCPNFAVTPLARSPGRRTTTGLDQYIKVGIGGSSTQYSTGLRCISCGEQSGFSVTQLSWKSISVWCGAAKSPHYCLVQTPAVPRMPGTSPHSQICTTPLDIPPPGHLDGAAGPARAPSLRQPPQLIACGSPSNLRRSSNA